MPFGSRNAEQAVADDHGDHRVAAAAAAIHGAHRGEDVGRRDARRAHALQLRGQHVEQHFGIGAGVEVAAVFALEHFAELARVGEIAVVREADAVGRIHVEGLRFGGAVAAGGGITHVADADVALELQHVVLLEDVAHQALALAHEQLAVGDRGDARGVLAAMLQHRQGVIDPLIDSAGSDDSGNAAHSVQVLRLRRRVWADRAARVPRRRCRAGHRRRRWRRASAGSSSSAGLRPCAAPGWRW